MKKITPVKPTEERMSLMDELRQDNRVKLTKVGSTQIKTLETIPKMLKRAQKKILLIY